MPAQADSRFLVAIAPRNDKNFETLDPQTNMAAHRQADRQISSCGDGRPRPSMPSEARQADECVRRYVIPYCPGITVTGTALAITGP